MATPVNTRFLWLVEFSYKNIYQYGHGKLFPDILEGSDVFPCYIRDGSKPFSFGWRLNYQ